MAEIRIDSLTKKFGERTAIDGLSLTLPAAGIVALCGPSGSGKSTLLALLAGLEKPTSGTITGRGTVSISFQDPALLPWRTAEENVNLALGDRRATLGKARDLLAELGIDAESAAAYPAALSGGMRARVGIARALARPADIYLFDEPFAALDAATAATVASAIRRHTAGALVLAVIHDERLAADFSDTVIRFLSSPLSGYHITQKADV